MPEPAVVPVADALTDVLREAPEIVTVVEIHRPAPQVFDFVSNPALWHRWHPATLAVRGAPPRPLQVGESATELITAVGQRFETVWTVQSCDPPRLWAITTDAARGCARIVYRLQVTPTGCRFERNLRFRSHGRPWRWLDKTLVRWILRRQSSRTGQPEAGGRGGLRACEKSAMPAHPVPEAPLCVANARRSPDYGCALRLDWGLWDGLLGHAGNFHRL